MSAKGHLERPGAYVLIIDLAVERNLEVGRLGSFVFPAGTYAYVGSAMKGLGARLGRHVNPERKNHWHIDSLTRAGEIRGAFLFPSRTRQECTIAGRLASVKGAEPFCRGFGCSDCFCETHLFLLRYDAYRQLARGSGEFVPSDALVRRSSRR
ncbi:MAG TPA: GIY-YIG nuclease family protein [Methanomassiliicoccales archaeon]|nr:GIY-YIG nuclease family protein [Methanomassiliicoccales archaeon]